MNADHWQWKGNNKQQSVSGKQQAVSREQGAVNMTGSAVTETPGDGGSITVTGPRVACDGGGGPLGHPRVWLTLGTDGEITCPYCSRHYVKATGADDD